ncbi:MFS transporter [Micromonospora sp. BQ11]|uniref:MFS transporter n=1 Tax=Micromonospora sp. BQ11 TaxID=3452212 RepID=UPI003F8A8A4A
MSRYLALLRLPGALRAALPAALARLAVSMISLALLFALVGAGHTYAVAGAVGGAYAVGMAAGAPIWGRVADRRGPSLPLGLCGLAVAAPLAALAVWPRQAPPLLIALALLSGLLSPPVGASMRALWTTLTPDPAARTTAHALEATLSELLFVVGPAAVGGLAAWGSPSVALVASATLLSTGATGFALSPAVRASRPATPARGGVSGTRPRLYRPGGLVVLAAIGLTAALSSALAVAVTAYISTGGRPSSWAGPIIALESVGSVVGGLWYGARVWRGEPVRRYLWLLAVLAAGAAALPLTVLVTGPLTSPTGLVLVAALVLVGGIPIAIVGTEEFSLIGDLSPAARRTQAFAGVGSVIAVGSAAGTAAAGAVADTLSTRDALFLPAACVILALVLVAAARRVLRSDLAAAVTAAAHHRERITA